MLLSLFGCSHKESSVVKIYEMSGDTWKTRGSALGNRAQGQAAGNEAQGGLHPVSKLWRKIGSFTYGMVDFQGVPPRMAGLGATRQDAARLRPVRI